MTDVVMKQPSMAVILGCATLLGLFGGGVATYSTQVAFGAEGGRQQARFETAVTAKFDATQKESDLRTAVINTRIDQLTTQMGARFEVMDRRDEVRNDRVTAIDNRLNRIEAQLAYLVQAAGAKR